MKVKCDKTNVVIFTSRHRIEGTLHITENNRLSDILNTQNLTKNFLPLTSVKMFDLTTNQSIKSDFLSVNKEQIEIIMEAS